MKKSVRLMALALAAVMMISFCSCSAKNEKDEDESENPVRVISSDQFKSGDEDFQGASGLSGSVFNQIFELSSDVLGKDLDTAEKMIGEYFGVDLVDRTGNIITTTINGVVTTEHVYVQMLTKDTVRFNGLVILTDKETGLVKRVELELTNSDYIQVHIDDTPEFRDEIKKLAHVLAKENNIIITADGISYSLAKEAALKTKETSYKNISAAILGEFMHGHVAVLNNKSTLIYIAVDKIMADF